MVRSLKATQNSQPFLQDVQKPGYKLRGETAPRGKGSGEGQEEEQPLKNNKKQVHNNPRRLFLATEVLHSCGLRFYLRGSTTGGEKTNDTKGGVCFPQSKKNSSGMN